MASSNCIQCSMAQANNTALDGWLPSYLGTSRLKLWLRADAANITLNGATVSAWADWSGNALHATQGTPAKQPTYVASTAGLNNQPSCLFSNAAATYLTTAVIAAVAQPTTIMLVSRSGTLSANLLACDGAFGSAVRQVIGVDGAKNVLGYAGTVVSSATQWGDNTSHVSLVELSGASSVLCLDSYTTPIAASDMGTYGFTGLTIGAAINGMQNWAGHIPEVVAVAGISPFIRKQLMVYAGRRYGIAVS